MWCTVVDLHLIFPHQQCVANGVSYEKIPHEGSSVTSLEVFFSGYPRMVGLALFPKLCQLTVVGQNIRHIQSLEACPMLRELWVVECQLTVSTGFITDLIYLYTRIWRKCTENLFSRIITMHWLMVYSSCVQKRSYKLLTFAGDFWTSELHSTPKALPLRQPN